MPEPLTVPPGYAPLINPAGELKYYPEASVKENIDLYGYKIPTEKDIEHATLKKAYGDGFGNELAAAVEGAASGATFGLSRHVENILGITTPEAQAARKEFSPMASGVGEVGGIIGSLAFAPGMALPGLVERGAMKAGAKIVGAGLLEKESAALIGNRVAQEILGTATQKLAANTVGRALEGMVYGAGMPISESALGDPTITAQKVFGQIGLGGLIGGGVGAATSLLGIGAGRLFKKAEAAEIPAEIAPATFTGEGTITPKGPMKMEGTIDFGLPDEKILERAQTLNPKTPLRSNDLNWLKENGMPDAQGRPTIFSKIGTEELPTLNLGAKDKVTLADKLEAGLRKLNNENVQMDAGAENILRSDARIMSREEYQGMFQKVADDIKASPEFGDPPYKRAVTKMEEWAKSAKDLPDDIDALTVKQKLKTIRKESKMYSIREGLKDDPVSQAFNDAQRNVDSWLKKNDEYKAAMEAYKPVVDLGIDLERHLKLDMENIDSGLISNWTENRVVKPYQNQLYGSMKPSMQQDAKILDQLGAYSGVDIGKTVKANLIYGKIAPDLAEGLQRGTWGAQVAEGIGQLRHPTEIPGKMLTGMAKIALTGEMPEFVQRIQAKGMQDVLLGKSVAKSGAVDSILGMIKGGAQSKLFDPAGPLGSYMVPAGVKFQQYLDSHDTMESAHSQLEVLTGLEKAQQKADKAIDVAISGIFSGSASPKVDYSGFLGKSSKEAAEDLETISADAARLSNDPNLLVEKLTEGLRGIGDHAPNITTGLNMTAVRAIQFLSQKISTMQPQDQRAPLDEKHVPSKMQLVSLAKTLKYLNSPYEVLKELPSGMVSNEGKEVLVQVYPELYLELKGRVMNGIADQQSRGKAIPTAKRLGLSFFLDQNLDSTLKPQAMQANQAAFMMPMATQNTPKSTGRPDAAGRMMSGTQKIAGRQ